MAEKLCSECSSPFDARTNGVACSARCKRTRRLRKQAAWKAENPDRVSSAGAARYARNRELIAEKVKVWRAENRLVVTVSKREAKRTRAQREASRRALVTNRDLARMLSRTGHSCSYCGSRLTAVHWDHIVPIAKGGATTIGNLAPSCPSCNLSKGSKLLIEWRVWRTRHGIL